MYEFDEKKILEVAKKMSESYDDPELLYETFEENVDQLEHIWNNINEDLMTAEQEVSEEDLIINLVSICLANINKMLLVTKNNPEVLNNEDLPNVK